MTKNDTKLLARFTDTVDDLIFWSFRYFLGRQSIAASSFARDLERAWELLSAKSQKMIEKEVDEALDKTQGIYYIREKYAREMWEALAKKWRKE